MQSKDSIHLIKFSSSWKFFLWYKLYYSFISNPNNQWNDWVQIRHMPSKRHLMNQISNSVIWLIGLISSRPMCSVNLRGVGSTVLPTIPAAATFFSLKFPQTETDQRNWSALRGKKHQACYRKVNTSTSLISRGWTLAGNQWWLGSTEIPTFETKHSLKEIYRLSYICN